MAAEVEVQGDARDAASMKRFFVVWGGQAFSLLGSSLVQFALVWWITKTTGSATYLAVAATAAILPQIVVGPFAGALVDRWSRRRVMIAADAGVAAATGVLAILFYLDVAGVWEVCALLAVRASGAAFHWPAMQASTTLMVPERHLSRIGGLNQALHGAGTVGGPPLGALLLEVMSVSGVLAVDIVTAAIAISTLAAIRIPNPARANGDSQGQTSILSDIRECLGLIRSWPGMPALLMMFMIMNFIFAPADALLPLLAVERFGGGVVEFASLQSTFGVGMLAGGLLLGAWGGFRSKIVTMLSALCVGGVGIAAIGMVPPDRIIIAIAFVLVIGVMLSVANGVSMALLQAKIPPEMQGRMFTMIGMVCTAMMPVGLSLAGPVAEVVGVHRWYVISGVVIALAAVTAALHPKIIGIENHSSAAPADPDGAA
ncbi:MAG: MFS transporter [Methanobacteriota archaeon]|nr:MAG: MFS transporter [Euryarchaeota archaeon]